MRSGAANKIGALFDVKLTKLGKSRMDELTRLLELADLRFKQAAKGLYDDIAERDSVRRIIGEKFGGWRNVPSQAMPQELTSLVVRRFRSLRATFEDSYIRLFQSAEGGVTDRRARWLDRRLGSIFNDQRVRASSVLNKLFESFGVPVSVSGVPLDELGGYYEEFLDTLRDRVRIARLSRNLPNLENQFVQPSPPELELRAKAVPGLSDSQAAGKEHRVWVVHGRDERLRSGVFAFLRAIGLKPIEWTEATALTGKGSPYIGEVLDAAFRYAQAVVIVLSPDDEARLRPDLLAENDLPYEKNFTGQARPNVLFEAGMAFASRPENTLMVQLGELRPFTDVAGRHVIKLDDSAEARQSFAQRLEAAACPVNLKGTDWLGAGDLTPPTLQQHGITVPQAPAPSGEKFGLRPDTWVTISPVSRAATKSDYFVIKVDDLGVVIELTSGHRVRIPKADYIESWNDERHWPELHLTRKFLQGYFAGYENAEEFFLPR